MRFVIVFMLATTADFLWAGYISAVSGKQAVRAAAWSMAIAIVSGVIAINYVHAPVLLVSLAAGSFVGTYLSVVTEHGKAIRHHLWFSRNRLTVRFGVTKAFKVDDGQSTVSYCLPNEQRNNLA